MIVTLFNDKVDWSVVFEKHKQRVAKTSYRIPVADFMMGIELGFFEPTGFTPDELIGVIPELKACEVMQIEATPELCIDRLTVTDYPGRVELVRTYKAVKVLEDLIENFPPVNVVLSDELRELKTSIDNAIEDLKRWMAQYLKTLNS